MLAVKKTLKPQKAANEYLVALVFCGITQFHLRPFL